MERKRKSVDSDDDSRSDSLSVYLNKSSTIYRNMEEKFKDIDTKPNTNAAYQIPIHNFPSPMEDDDRDCLWYSLISEVNMGRERLRADQAVLFHKNGWARRDVILSMKYFIQESLIPKLVDELIELPILPCNEKIYGELFPYCRDVLVNIGAGFVLCGLYLIMMGSDKLDSPQFKASDYHLRKCFYETNDRPCSLCGHKNCPTRETCSPEKWIGLTNMKRVIRSPKNDKHAQK